MPDRIVTIARVSTSIPLLSRADISVADYHCSRNSVVACSTAVHFRAVQKQIGAMSSRIGLLLDAHGESQYSFRQFAAVPIGCTEHSVTHPWPGGSFGKISSDISPVTH
jgi:hypothetical protein